MPPQPAGKGGSASTASSCIPSNACPVCSCCNKPDYEVSHKISRISSYKVCSNGLTIHFFIQKLLPQWSLRESGRGHKIFMRLYLRPPTPTFSIFLRLWILLPRMSAHPPFWAQCKVHRPWALFRETTVLQLVTREPLQYCTVVLKVIWRAMVETWRQAISMSTEVKKAFGSDQK